MSAAPCFNGERPDCPCPDCADLRREAADEAAIDACPPCPRCPTDSRIDRSDGIAAQAEGGVSESIDPSDLPRTFHGLTLPSLNEERTWYAWQAAKSALAHALAVDEWYESTHPDECARRMAECARLEREYERAAERSAQAQMQLPENYEYPEATE